MRLKKKDKSSGVLISAPTSDLCDYKKSMVNADLSWMTPSNRWANIAVYPFLVQLSPCKYSISFIAVLHLWLAVLQFIVNLLTPYKKMKSICKWTPCWMNLVHLRYAGDATYMYCADPVQYAICKQFLHAHAVDSLRRDQTCHQHYTQDHPHTVKKI